MRPLEQELEDVTEELNQEIRRLHEMESAPYDGRACDTDVLRKNTVLQRERVQKLWRARDVLVADLMARHAT